ncbi:MAG: Holliday junction resolvase RuvX [Gemmatimonadaceae bacterium]|nr:Holliday junction resolvase RuvX [Gemmatimonadaceae bacterium]
MPPLPRYLAVDVGDKRIGLAVADGLGMLASPAGFIERRVGKRMPVAEVLRRAEALEAQGFVVGLPLDTDGSETPRCAEARDLASALTARSGLPAHLVDERFTTAIAQRAIKAMGGGTQGRKGDVDALAASVLLQHALDSAALVDATAPASDAPATADEASGDA